MPRSRTLYRFDQEGAGFLEDLATEGAKESIKGVDANKLIEQAVDHGVSSIDTQALKKEAKKNFKKGVKKGIKRKAKKSAPGRAIKRVKDIFG